MFLMEEADFSLERINVTLASWEHCRQTTLSVGISTLGRVTPLTLILWVSVACTPKLPFPCEDLVPT